MTLKKLIIADLTERYTKYLYHHSLTLTNIERDVMNVDVYNMAALKQVLKKYHELFFAKDWLINGGVDGVTNYVLNLLVERIDNDATIIHNWNLGINY